MNDLRETLDARLTESGAQWLDAAAERIAADAAAIRPLFPAVGRHCGRAPLDPAADGHGWTVDDAARALLLTRLPLTGPALAQEVADLYRYGDAAEKRGVLRGLHLLDLGDEALPLVHDALRTNDTRLVAAALGPYGAAHLDAHAYRHGVLKCVFTGVPLAAVAGLRERRDAELARMFTAFARERVAAGRPVPADVWLVTDPEED
ncbi:EboA domain-containing protein [Actinoallomurus sp. NBC_01490]|uniref:EboA domain-containing protein n=1 Tax=Actinoallomurus sp. NBC_01490 TaxID=2903557 RepID=UPI002E35B63C|nr:EboA domain-containing protein [Actinoallomurus sp. NBC_01490]